MYRLNENSASRTALLEMQNFLMSLICPDIPLLQEVEQGTPITMEHVAMLIQAIKGMGGKNLEKDISTLMEMIFVP